MSLPEGDYTLPMLLPSLQKVKALEKQLQSLAPTETIDGYRCRLKDWLKMALSIPDFVEALDLSSGCIEIKLGGDGFRITRSGGQVNMYFTLFNLGKLIHSPQYVFTLATWGGKEKYEELESNLSELFMEVGEVIQEGVDIDVKYTISFVYTNFCRIRQEHIKKHLKVEVFFCCDLGMTCEWLGLSNTANCFCPFCTVDRDSEDMVDFSMDSTPRKQDLSQWKVGVHGVQVSSICNNELF